MSVRSSGFFWCVTFVVLDAAQAVVFGTFLQRMDAFLLGGIVFGLASFGALIAGPIVAPGQITTALRRPALLAVLNGCTAGGWISYLAALQLIEPAVAFTIFSGAIPLTLIAAAALGVPEAEPLSDATEALGNGGVAFGMLLLAIFTVAGWSGFVRGGALVALAGVVLSVVSGVLMAGMLLASYRLNRLGITPGIMLGLRFPLYVAVAFAGYLLGLDANGAVPLPDLAWAVVVGLALLAFPIYAVQKAVSLTSSLALGTATALIPLVVFLMQSIEGRVAYSGMTLLGLSVYFAGALLALFGRVRRARTANA